MSSFWSAYIIIITFGFIAGLAALIYFTSTMKLPQKPDETMGHEFDGIEEYNKPMPKWWLQLFAITIIFGVGYLIYYPTGWTGLGGWTSEQQLRDEQIAHAQRYGAVFSEFARTPITDLQDNTQALRMGQRIYENNCSVCHGVSAAGAYGFPDLTNGDWQWGGTPEAITTTLLAGRQAMMPSFRNVLSSNEIDQVTQYVMGLSGQPHNSSAANRGAAIYANSCAACHGGDGSGNQALGAPNLTNNIWLYDNPNLSLEEDIKLTLRSGRQGVMPGWQAILGNDQVHLVAAYIYSLGGE
ncbi:cytochrome-c oxidase, cbb3-type subunit III [Salinispirillum sp. LH 10-3-1]|uniref:Cbb3-type cytochrome c oxidase subunit n=1 Tax=Salinispirillum sp. LH 10-3-1 TaxID=2952525 RepID=A0AB38YD32_9GAMM